MANFVDDDTDLPFPKTNLKPLGASDPNKIIVDTDWNTVCQAIIDLRTAVLALRGDSTQPLDVGDASNPGNSGRAARANHVHAHGTGHPGGTAHTTATGSSAGFMSPADKLKLDALASAGGWISITDVGAQGGGFVSNKVYQDIGNTILQSCVASTNTITVTVKASAPLVSIHSVTSELTLDGSGGFYQGTVNVTIASIGEDLTVQSIDPNGNAGASDTVAITVDSAPQILTLAFTGGYPGIQSELKAGDTFQIHGTTDKAATGVQILDFEACIAATISFSSNTSFTVTGTIADRGNTLQSLHARLQARNAAGAYGTAVTTSNTVDLNNLHPTISFPGVVYPASQGAIKNSETADVYTTITNGDTTLHTCPNGQVSIPNPTVIEAFKTVTRTGGSYNVSTNNYTVLATRTANGASTTASTVVRIANVAAVVSIVTPAARLRSGGNNGTTVQNHTITMNSDQLMYSNPTMSAAAGGGTFIGSWFSPSSSLTWTRTLQVHDNDTKGTYSWQSLTVTNLAGIVTSSISSGASYVLGGFVPRTLTFGAFSQTTTLNTAVVTYSKLQASIFTATNQPAVRNASQGNHSNLANQFTVDTLGVNPTTVYWNDAAAAASNSGGTAQITNLEEIV